MLKMPQSLFRLFYMDEIIHQHADGEATLTEALYHKDTLTGL